nr:malectin-like carbohydrate-binding domain-containing protein [Tanacetum cinerariifolium]
VNGNPSLCTSGNSCSSPPGSTQDSPPGSTPDSPPGNTPGSTNVVRRKKKSSMLPIILGIAIPVFVLFWVAAGVFIILRKKKRTANINMPAVVVTRDRANVLSGGTTNGNPYIVQRTGEGLGNENAGSPVPQVVVPAQHVA